MTPNDPCNPTQRSIATPGDRPRTPPPTHSATFHLDDGRYLVLTVVRAPSSGFELGPHKTRLELFSADRALLRRANLAPLLREEPSEPAPGAWTPTHPAYRGTWASEHEYITHQLAEHMPSYLTWLLPCCDPRRLREGYEAGKLRIWSIPHPRQPGRVWIFEAPRP
jgi:hypothetical protein